MGITQVSKSEINLGKRTDTITNLSELKSLVDEMISQATLRGIDSQDVKFDRGKSGLILMLFIKNLSDKSSILDIESELL